MRGLTGNSAVITGAGSGLGRSLAKALASEGWKVGIVDIDNSGAAETAAIVERAGGSAETFHADVSEPGGVKAYADHYWETWGGVDLLINNAGVACAGSVGEIPLEDWDWVIGVNFLGMLYGCHEFVPRMKARGGGHIINVASLGGLVSLMHMAPYNTTKMAVVSLSETLAMELSDQNIGITVACPSFFKTGLLDEMRCTEDWERDFARITFDNARMSSDEVARRIIAAAKKNRLYATPQFSVKMLWSLKRLSPETNSRIFGFLNRRGVLVPLMTALARRGLVQ